MTVPRVESLETVTDERRADRILLSGGVGKT